MSGVIADEAVAVASGQDEGIAGAAAAGVVTTVHPSKAVAEELSGVAARAFVVAAIGLDLRRVITRIEEVLHLVAALAIPTFRVMGGVAARKVVEGGAR
jgi:hypothetical protein